MKGNHNYTLYMLLLLVIVFNKSKIQNERKSQQPYAELAAWLYCVQQVKDTKWKEITTEVESSIRDNILCSTSQRYKMKGNHNTVFEISDTNLIVFNKSKIQNERKSQLYQLSILIISYCVQQVKDTKWKEITTCCFYIIEPITLCSTSQRYKMKGNHN